MKPELEWCLRPLPEDVLVAWGARAIFDKGSLDIPPGRQNCMVDVSLSADADRTFFKWINNKAMKALKKHIKGNRWTIASEEVFKLDDGDKHCRASCSGSYGYCYITCWQDPEKASADEKVS